MHIYAMTRGIKHDVDRFITELQGKYMKYLTDPEGRDIGVQLAVRPIQLWEFVFPEQHLQCMLNTLFVDTTRQGYSYSYKNDKYLSMMRIALRAKKLPPLDPKSIGMPVYKSNIEVAGIGYKEDEFKEGIEQL